VHVVTRGWFGQCADQFTTTGTGIWSVASVGPGGLNSPAGTMSNPAVTMNDDIENIAAIDFAGNLDFYWQNGDGSYIQEVVAKAASL
jgi:hypothetical protein